MNVSESILNSWSLSKAFLYSLGCGGNNEENRMWKRTQFSRVDSRTENILLTCVTNKLKIATILLAESEGKVMGGS